MVVVIALSTGLAITLSLQTYNEMSLVFHSVPGEGAPEDLVTIQLPVAYNDFKRYAMSDGPFAELAAYMGRVPISVQQQGTTRRLWGNIVTPNYFEVLKSDAALGRTFSGQDKETGAANIVIGEGYWQRNFGGSSSVIGQRLQINGQSATIIGVATRDFVGASPLTAAAEMWISTESMPPLAPELAPAFLHDSSQRNFQIVGRLKPGITKSEAETELDIIAKELEEQRGDAALRSNQGRRVTVLPGGQLFPVRKEDLPTAVAPAVTLEGLVLLLACANAGTLLLAKAGLRNREITVRVALGASRRRVIKQLLTESVMLGIPGGVVGLMLAFVLNYQTQKFIASVFPSHVRLDLSMGWSAVALAFGISMIAGILFGLVPALKASRIDLISGLKGGNGWFLPGYRWFSSRNGLVLAQVASSIALVILAGIISLGFQRASSTADFGFDPRDVYSFSIDPLREGYSAERTWDLLEKLPARLRTISGIVDSSIALNPPVEDVGLRTMSPRLVLTNESQPAQVDSGNTKRTLSHVSYEYVSPAYFDVLSVRPLRGRLFEAFGRGSDQNVIVVNQTLAKEAWPAEDSIGRQLEIGATRYEVIGVINDFRASGLLASAPPVAFRRLKAEDVLRPTQQGVAVIVRANPGSDIAGKLAQEFAAIEPNLTVFNIANQKDRLTQVLLLSRIQTISYGVIGIFGLLLAAVGLAGVTAYAVARRTKEIGIRLALGASRFQILRLVGYEGVLLVIVGTLVGEVCALTLTRILNAWFVRLYDVTRNSSSDPFIIIGAPVLLGTLTVISCYLPARRSLKIDPASALRQE